MINKGLENIIDNIKINFPKKSKLIVGNTRIGFIFPLFILLTLCIKPYLSEANTDVNEHLNNTIQWLNSQEKLSRKPSRIGQVLMWELYPTLSFEKMTGWEAIHVLGKLGYYCSLFDEVKDKVWPGGKVHPAKIHCIRLLWKNAMPFGKISSFVHMENWQGDGTPLAKRFDELVIEKVSQPRILSNVAITVSTQGFSLAPYTGKEKDEEIIKELEQGHDFFKLGNELKDVAFHAMVNSIQCKIESKGEASNLACYKRAPAPCFYALISFEINKGKDEPLLLLNSSTSKVKKGRSSWQCLRVHTY